MCSDDYIRRLIYYYYLSVNSCGNTRATNFKHPPTNGMNEGPVVHNTFTGAFCTCTFFLLEKFRHIN